MNRTENNSSKKQGTKTSTTNSIKDEASIKNKKQSSTIGKTSSNKESQATNDRAKQVKAISKKGWIIAVVVLSIFLTLSLATIGVLSYFVAVNTSHTAFTIGDELTIVLEENGCATSSIIYPSNAIPNMSIKQPITLFQPNNTTNLLIRVRMTVSCNEGDMQIVKAIVPEHWSVGEDGYYYYKGIGHENNHITFSSEIEIPKMLETKYERENCVITIVVESLQKTNGLALVLWDTAPATWLEDYAK